MESYDAYVILSKNRRKLKISVGSTLLKYLLCFLLPCGIFVISVKLIN